MRHLHFAVVFIELAHFQHAYDSNKFHESLAPLFIIGCLQCAVIPNYSLPPVVVVGLPCQSHGHYTILTTDLTLIPGDSMLIGNIRDIFVIVQHKLCLDSISFCLWDANRHNRTVVNTEVHIHLLPKANIQQVRMGYPKELFYAPIPVDTEDSNP